MPNSLRDGWARDDTYDATRREHGFFLRQGDGRCMGWTIWEGHRGSSINIRVAWRWDSAWNQHRKRVSDTSEGI